jgi:hypothetical protein
VIIMPKPIMRALLLLAAYCALALSIAGCGDDPAAAPEAPWPPDGFASTPDQLMANFRSAYETMSPAALLAMMRGDHLTILQASTVTQFPDVGPTLDRTEEARIHERMFSGDDVVDPEGMLIPGIQSITFHNFTRQGSWTTSAADDQIPGTPCALYDVLVRFDRGQNYSILTVQGQLKFYVVARDSTHNGQTLPYYQLRGQMDLTQNSLKAQATEASNWGSVKALFR